MAQHSREDWKLVEFYDSEPLENVLSLLYGDYSGVTFVYFANANEPDARGKACMEHFVEETCGFLPQFLAIGENSISAALEAFRALIASGGKYDFDITGGSSVFVAAAGALLQEDGGRRMALHEYSMKDGGCVFRTPQETLPPRRKTPIRLTVAQMLALRDIRVLGGRLQGRKGEEKQQFRQEVFRLWDTVRGENRAWNTLCTLSPGLIPMEDGAMVEKKMPPHQYEVCRPMLDKLKRAGFLSQLQSRRDGGSLAVSYRLHLPQQYWGLFEKAGNLLETVTCLAAEQCPGITDCCTGVEVDWDSRSVVKFPNPTNEIDVIAAWKHISCFISCKNTGAENDYLYEIMTMARHFGGKYALPVLVAATDSNPVLRVRAEESGILLIDNVGSMTAKEFTERLSQAFSEI